MKHDQAKSSDKCRRRAILLEDPSCASAPATIEARAREYIQPAPAVAAKRPGLFTRLLRARRRDKRVMTMGVKGLSLERFRRILEQTYCSVDKVEVSDDGNLAFVDFVYLSDNGYCMAILSDKVADGSFIRCAFITLFAVAPGPGPLNALNKMSKFLKFYALDQNRTAVEYPVLTVDISDTGVAASIEVFHDSVTYIASHGFSY